jgi:hypothetical protein
MIRLLSPVALAQNARQRLSTDHTSITLYSFKVARFDVVPHAAVLLATFFCPPNEARRIAVNVAKLPGSNRLSVRSGPIGPAVCRGNFPGRGTSNVIDCDPLLVLIQADNTIE